jgi:hypothetical protein
MQSNTQKNAYTDKNSPAQTAPYFTVAQQVLRMEWEGGHAVNPNPERTTTQSLPRIDQWWLAGRSMNEKSQ